MELINNEIFDNFEITKKLFDKENQPQLATVIYERIYPVSGKSRITENNISQFARHTSSSLYLTQGLPIVNLSRRLGHARPSITLDIYGHMLPSLRNDVVERIDAMITPVPITGELEKLKSGCTRVAHNFNDD